MVAGLVAALWFLFLQDDSITEAEATYDGSELTVELPDGASITVPPGAARPGSRVRARVVRPEEAPDLPAYARAILASWDFDVEGGILAPVTIRLPTSLAGESWVLALYRDNQWVPTGFDIVGGEIVAVVDHLTFFSFLQHVCAIGAQLVFDTHCLGMLTDAASAALDAYDSILEPDHCGTPDHNILVSNGHANGMIHGCTLLPSSAPEEREDSRLIVQNIRKFVLDIHVTSGSAKAIISPYPIPSCCGGVTIVDGGSSFWLPDTRASRVHITGKLSFNAVIGQVAYFTLLFVPGIDSVTKHPELVTTIYHAIIEFQAIKEAQLVFQGDRSGGFEALIPVLRDAGFLKDLAGHIADRVGDRPHLLTRLGVQLPREIFDEVFKIIDVVEVAITLRDLEKALIETDRLEGVAQFHLDGLPDGWMATLLPPPTPAASPPVTVQEPPRPAVFLQGPPSSFEPVTSPEELAATDGLWTADDALLTAVPLAPLPKPPTTATTTPTPSLTLTPAPASTPSAGLILASVSAGREHSCGVKPDGSVICWGRNHQGQAAAPAGTFTSVSAGWEHTCGVRTDGSVACWGAIANGKANPPPGSFKAVSAGHEHTCGLQADGSVVCWGASDGHKRTESPLGSFTSISAGQYHTCGVTEDASITCWGNDFLGAASPPDGAFASVAVSDGYTCGLRTDGSISCWGSDSKGRASPPPGAFVSISAGHWRGCAIRADQSAICWGRDSWDPLLQPSDPLASVSVGEWHICGVKADGSATCWGRNDYGQAAPPGIPFLSISPSDSYTCGVRTDGSIDCWGISRLGTTSVPSGSFVSISSGRQKNCVVRTTGELACWGYEGGNTGPLRAPSGSFLLVSTTSGHSCALLSSGSIECWGDDYSGETAAPSGHFVSVSVSQRYSCGLRTDGSVACWGRSADGHAAPPDTTFTSIDLGSFRGCGVTTGGAIECWGGGVGGDGRAVGSASPFVSVSAGANHTCGLRSDGTAECWGGSGSDEIPVPAGPFTSIESEGRRACGVRLDGTAECWEASLR